MLFPFLAVSAVMPSFLLMWYFHRRDVFREPPRALWAVFLRGVLIVFPVLLVAWPLSKLVDAVEAPLLAGLLGAFLLAAIPEEGFKLLAVWRYAARRVEFDEPMDGVVYGVAASLGFATFENLIYVGSSGVGVAVMRALTAVPSHAFLGAIMGYYVGRAKLAPADARGGLLRKAFLVPMLLHGLYDFPLLAAQEVGRSASSPDPLFVSLLSLVPLVVVGEWIWAMRLGRRLRVAQADRWEATHGQQEAGDSVLPRPSIAPGRWSSILLTVSGAVAASLGGLLVFGIALAFALGGPEPDQMGPLAAGAVLFGLTPLAAGAAVFAWGIVRLNESDRLSPP